MILSAQSDGFADFEREALAVPGVSQMYKHDLQRTTKCKRFEDDSAVSEGALFDRKSKFQIETFNVIINKLISCLGHRLDAYKHLCDLFGVGFMPERDHIGR